MQTAAGKNRKCKIHHRQIHSSVQLQSLSLLISQSENPFIFGGNKAKADNGRFSYWTAKPIETFEFNTSDKKPFEKLQEVLDRYESEENIETLPEGIFCGGWAGYFSYELGRFIEKIPQTTTDDYHLPLIRLCFYDSIICYDHKENTFILIALDTGGLQAVEGKFTFLEDCIRQAENIPDSKFDRSDMDINPSEIDCNMNKQYYLDSIEKIKKHIYDGDIYQVNFSQRFQCDFENEAIELFGWQNENNPSAYSAYIDAGVFKIVSASPEMFLTITDRVIRTQPIKGTRARLAQTNPENIKTNQKNLTELLTSEKENAELNMIIDLERNDLGRICRYGSIKVTQPRTIEKHPTVFHASAVIEGSLRDEIGFCDILKAVFPGGSITGAPKIRSMEIIDEIETTERSVYTGSIGFIGVDGSVCLNIAIRTIIIKDQKAFVQSGGGIVADSDKYAEWDETIIKAKALLAGIISINDQKNKGA